MDLEIMGQYFNVVTDTLAIPPASRTQKATPLYTKEDLTRATAEEIAACDYVLVGMTNAYMTSYEANAVGAFGGVKTGVSNTEGVEGQETETDGNTWYPATLQYGEYVAETAPETSISGKVLEDGTKENRSYKGNANQAPKLRRSGNTAVRS